MLTKLFSLAGLFMIMQNNIIKVIYQKQNKKVMGCFRMDAMYYRVVFQGWNW